MRKYETVLISDPDIQDQARTDLFDKVRNIIAKGSGFLIDFDDWGNKKLSYEIKKKLRGHYVCVTYGGSGELVKELERNMRLSDDVMKFMTILLSDHVTLEQLEKEAEEAKIKPKKSDETDGKSDEEDSAVEDDASEEEDDDADTEEEPE